MQPYMEPDEALDDFESPLARNGQTAVRGSAGSSGGGGSSSMAAGPSLPRTGRWERLVPRFVERSPDYKQKRDKSCFCGGHLATNTKKRNSKRFLLTITLCRYKTGRAFNLLPWLRDALGLMFLQAARFDPRAGRYLVEGSVRRRYWARLPRPTSEGGNVVYAEA